MIKLELSRREISCLILATHRRAVVFNASAAGPKGDIHGFTEPGQLADAIHTKLMQLLVEDLANESEQPS